MLSKSLSFSQKQTEQSEAMIFFRPVIILTSLVVLFIVLRLWHINTYSLWGGEAFTMIGAHKSWSDMFAYIVADIVHPPLIYVLLKLWIMIGGESVLWLKLLPALSGIVVVIPFLLLCRELDFRLPEINLALLIAAVNGYLIHYTQELRMYSLFMFLAVCSFWLFVRYFNSPGRATRQLLILTVINLLAIYTHYYGWVVIGMEFLFLLIWLRQKVVAFGLSMLFLLLCFVPWAYLVVQEARAIGGLAQNLDWIPKPGLVNILKLYVTFNGPIGSRYAKLLGLALFGLPLLFWFWEFWVGSKERKDELRHFSWLALLAFLPVIILYIISQRMNQAIWMDRYFIFITIPYMMLVAKAVYQIKPLLLRNIWIVAIVIWSLLAGFNGLSTNRIAWESPQLGSRVDWDGLTQQMIAAEAGATGPINVYTLTSISNGYLSGDWALSTSIDYFMDLHGDDRFQMTYARDVQALLDRAVEEHFWVGFFELAESPRPSPAKVLANNGYQLGEALVVQEQNNHLVLLPVWRK